MSIVARRLHRLRQRARSGGPDAARPDVLRLHAVGYLWGYHGYAIAFRRILAELERDGAHVSAWAVTESGKRLPLLPDEAAAVTRWTTRAPAAPQVVLSFLPPQRLARRTEPSLRGARRVAIAEFESPEIPAAFVRRLNAQDLIWNPSRWGVEAFERAGVSVPVEHFPHGVDVDRFQNGARAAGDRDALRFLTVATFQPRKGHDLLFRAAARALRGRDRLVVVAHGARPADVHALAESCRLAEGRAAPLELELHPTGLSPEELVALYRGADAFVLPTRGEGDGLPVREAMAAGLPVVASNVGPIAEVLDEAVGYPVEGAMRRGLSEGYGTTPSYYRRTAFFEPDLGHLADQIQAVIRDYDTALAKGVRARDRMTHERSWSHVVRRMGLRLAAFASGQVSE